MFEQILLSWWALPLMIFLARILDVSIGTIRLIFISKGLKYYAPILGFFEVLIWLLAVKNIMVGVASTLTIIAYGLGFSTGTYIGMIIEEKIMTGNFLVRIMTKNQFELIEALNKENQRYTIVDGESETGKVKVIFLIVSKKKMNTVMNIIQTTVPTAYYTIENVKYARDSIETTVTNQSFFTRFGFHRKAK